MPDNPIAFKIARLHPHQVDHQNKTYSSPQKGFGAVWLGQQLTLQIVLVNISSDSQPVFNVGIRIEVQSDRGKTVLYDSMPTRGLAALDPGEQYQLPTLEYSVKDLGQHTLLCSSAFTATPTPADPRFVPEAFKFNAFNPLLVKTKHRGANGGGATTTVFLEATVENKTPDDMILDAIDLLPSPGYQCTAIIRSTEHTSSSNTTTTTNIEPLQSITTTTSSPSSPRTHPHPHQHTPSLAPHGGSYAVIFQLDRQWSLYAQDDYGSNVSTTLPTPPATTTTNAEGSSLGKLDIRWRGGPMGDAARLQTQTIIVTPPRPLKELRMEVQRIPGSTIWVGRPFFVDVVIKNETRDRRLGPLKLSYLFNPRTTDGGGQQQQQQQEEEGIVLDGQQSIGIDMVGPGEKKTISVPLIARRPGRHTIHSLLLTNDRDGRLYDSIPPVEVCVVDAVY